MERVNAVTRAILCDPCGASPYWCSRSYAVWHRLGGYMRTGQMYLRCDECGLDGWVNMPVTVGNHRTSPYER